MYRRVAVVTDSTACLPTELAAQSGISVVQLELQVGERADSEGRIPVSDVVSALRERVPVVTSPPDPGAFFWAYQDAAAAGMDAVVSVHISGRLSQTCASARQAAEQVRIPVHVIDSGTTGMTLGYAVLTAARLAGRGATAEQVANAAVRRSAAGSELIYVDTLEYLRRGGRIGAASALLGTALSIKPLLTIAEGEIAPLARALGSDRALRKLIDIAAKRSLRRQVDLGIEHYHAPELAATVRDRLRRRIPNTRDITVTEVSSILGAHVGPGTISVAVSPVDAS
ncbi:DegV family protein [Goodfellowiella coeruleoviolacea]|uniref:EDD domain protein, DegV family n=1 Tax=Goodfellowiella coeruleoviolacea TaxID=334858 RepID=A0AAE3KI43_9PSEU|nr:DegV family protein [Goodfellowiella coeruleoviolacea]MCP2167044.1 EDD domain protein, DegV family [Goodfellowiella coeruleoviolacea]